jgi:hypothetical protein
MIQLKDLDTGMAEVLDNDLQIVNGMGFTLFDTSLGAVAGGIGSGLGTTAYNYSTGKPLDTGLYQSIGTGAVIGAFSPVNGVGSFLSGVSSATGGSFAFPTAVDAVTNFFTPPSGGYSTSDMGRAFSASGFGF